jgi:AraC family transcriptional regulator
MTQGEGNSHIRSLLRGSKMLGRSSREFGWTGFTIERHEVASGVKSETMLERHFVLVWTEPCYGERQNARGHFVAFSKKPGTVSLLPAGLIPPMRLYSPTEATVVAFEPEFIQNIKQSLERPSTDSFTGKLAHEAQELSTLVSLLMAECNSGAPHGRIYAESLAHAIAIWLLDLGRAERPHGSFYRGDHSPPSIRRVLERMHAEFDGNLSLDALAAESGYSRRHFLRIFEEATKCTPHQYLIQLRIKHAKGLIRRTSMPLIDVAAYSGFSSQSHMSQLFRKYCGATPTQVRRNRTYS